MKSKRIIPIMSFIMLFIMSFNLFAASNGNPNVINVNWLKKYNPNKLSVISFYDFIYMDDIISDKTHIIPANLDYIIKINGKSIEDIKIENIYPLINGKEGRVTLLLHSITHDEDYELSYNPINLNKKGFDETLENIDGIDIFSSLLFDNYLNSGVEVRTDDNISDWAKYRKISIVLSSSDPLLEKELANTALKNLIQSGFPLIVDDKDPDLILKVSFNEEESVTSTYVPQTTTYIDQGNDTYITKGKYGIYINSFKRSPKKITEGGYTHEDISNYHFLEVSLLDAKKMLDPNQITAPIVWQLHYSKRLKYSESLYYTSLSILKYCRAFPSRNVFYRPCNAWSGICWDENKSVITDIYKNSPAEKLGLHPGDEIIKINGNKKIEIKSKKWLKKNFIGENPIISVSFKKYSLGKLLTGKFSKVFPQAFLQSSISYRVDNNSYIDYAEIKYPEFIHAPNNNNFFEIKRNGKKLILKGPLYQKCEFSSIDIRFLE